MPEAQMTEEMTKWLAGLGVGGTIAAFMFWFYRKDMKSYTELWKEATAQQREMTLTVLSIVEKSTAAHVMNTSTNNEMIGLIRALHRRLDVEDAPAGYNNSSATKRDG